MKKIPYNFIDKVAEAMNEACEVNNCEECIFYLLKAQYPILSVAGWGCKPNRRF